ncbi:MAG TPA: rhomboid family intramembrane serine protease [Cryptosporangiaceae bacterium]|nr:rhomboid family intramembrane serine protease [Cryptosporangiaceae bacterium]
MTEESRPATAPAMCYRHPERETGVSCTRCGRPICPDCMNAASVGFQCPDCVREGNRGIRTARTVFGGSVEGERGTVTKALIGVNLALWLLTIVAAVLTGDVSIAEVGRLVATGGTTGITEWGAALPLARCSDGALCGIAAGEYYRLLTADFLHYGLIHIGFNMYVLWVFGRECERLLGRSRFLALYLLTGVGGSVAVYAFGAPNVASAGASASIFGLLGALFFFFRRLRMDMRGLTFLIVGNFALGFFIPNISILGHLGGLAAGAAIGALLAYAPSGPHRTAIQVSGMAAVAVAMIGVVVIRTAQYGVLL